MQKLLDALEKWANAGFPLTTVHKAAALFIVLLGFIVYFGYQVSTEVPTTPCMPNGYPARCYYISEDTCNVVWSKAKNTCTEWIKSLSLPPGRLSGPIEFKCQLMYLDRAFEQSRKTTNECTAMYNDLQDWKRRNSFQ